MNAHLPQPHRLVNPFRNGELSFWRSHPIGLCEGTLGCSIYARTVKIGFTGFRGGILKFSLELPRAEAVLVLRHVHAAAAKAHALQLQPRALFQAGFILQLDGAARAYHALPRQ